MIINKRLITKCLYEQGILNIISEYEIHKNNYTEIKLEYIYYYITMILGYPFNSKFVNTDFNVRFDIFLDILHKLNIPFIAKIKVSKNNRLLCVSNSYLNLSKLLIISEDIGYKLYNIYESNNEITTYTDYNYYKTKEPIDNFKLSEPLIKLVKRLSLNKLLDIYPNLPTVYKTVSEKEFKEYISGINHGYLLNYNSNSEGVKIQISIPSFNYTRFGNIVTHIELRVRQLHYIMENNPFAILIYPTLKTNFGDYIIDGKINVEKLNDPNTLMSFQTLGKGLGWVDDNVYLLR